MERLEATEDGRCEVRGRWFGVRGRRFVRPTLTLRPADGGPERRWLADLEHKPWAAEDGEPWMAVFSIDAALTDASAIELSVAPDIEIALSAPSRATGVTGENPVAERARSPMAKQSVERRRPSARAQDLERLSTRLSSAQAALERERARRAAADQTLEGLRAESRRLSAELGRARAELDLAHAAQRENEAMSAELDSMRRQVRAAERRNAELGTERDRAIADHARTEDELRELSGALESARDALEQERTRGAERVRDAQARAAGPRTSPPAAATAPDPDEVRLRPVALHRTERPMNPALRSRPNWIGRVLALLVIAAVIVAVWLVLHSTILH